MAKISRAMATLLLVPALTFSFVSCSDDDEGPDPNVITNLPGTATLTATEASNTTTIKFTALSAWEAGYANEASNWFTFTPASGAAGDITITIAAPYNDGAAKTGTLTLKHGTNTYNVVITQGAGKPEIPEWDADNKEALLQSSFAPDPYNATEEMPSTFTLKVKTIQDYTTIEEAPFEIMTFAADREGTPKDSLITWVKVTVAENSPASKDGKLLEMAIDTIDVNVTDSRKNIDNRYAYICIVPKGTDKADMFANGAMKEEYLKMGTSIEQQNYVLRYDPTVLQLNVTDMGVQEPTTSGSVTISSNCKYKTFVMSDNQSALENWWNINISDNILTLSYDLVKVRTLPMPGQASATIQLIIDRGEKLKPIPFKNQAPFMINYMKLF